ncbi:TM1812 family CRISPR-associated protein [Synechocystis sp. PCC 7339]|uniref:TM1812 family CRISPR-associated protein n=1 Tax=Synechocystis sp. PCC 7339 TaxID=2782213 RepID=UPI001CBE43B4|nr:TM1812 family CRISPR-associated protein [Synechocystis sp. PCC 7339]
MDERGLRQVKQVEVLGLVYGAFDKSKTNQPSPSYDLLPMLGLLDWMSAVERFTEAGDGRALSHLLESVLSPEEQAQDLSLKKAQNRLNNVAEKIQQVSQALALARPDETIRASSSLQKSLTNAGATMADYAKPFDLVRERVIAGYGQFAQQNREDLRESLRLQFQMIAWFMERGQILQAVTLGREWLVSWVAFQLGETDLLDKACRTATEGALHNGNNILKEKTIDRPSPLDQAFATLANQADVSRLWDQITQLRNDLAHVGMNKSPASVRNIESRAKERFIDLQKLLTQL